MTGDFIIHFINILLWCIIAASTFYVCFFSIASIIPHGKICFGEESSKKSSFLILFPAYKEDAVIINSVKTFLKQQYPEDLYKVLVISDHMEDVTNHQLASFPITLLLPSFTKSSKANALKYAIDSYNASAEKTPDYIVILDADNIVGDDFLARLDRIAQKDEVIQCHRTAKNSDNEIAALDGLSEEINNSIFRRGHNRIGMSSALIGSGMCFSYQWFNDNVHALSSAVEDRELEAILMKQRVFIRYAEDILVMDEKVDSSDNFQRQRLRWMTGQVQTFFLMIPYLPLAIIHGNINYIDKVIQQALIPRSFLLLCIPLFTIVSMVIFRWSYPSIMWIGLLLILILSLYIAIPRSLRSKAIIKKIFYIPELVWRMLKNTVHIRTDNKEFIHTTHHQ